MTKIGYNDGILGFVGWVRKISLGTVKFRPPAERPANRSQWSWLENLERTLRILKDENDAKLHPDPVDPPEDPPPPPAKRLAARTYNKVLPDGSDARYCKTSPGVTIHGDGSFDDEGGNHYSEAGRHESGPRDPNYQVPGIRQANNMNSQEPCQGYTEGGRTFPPWPAESYQ